MINYFFYCSCLPDLMVFVLPDDYCFLLGGHHILSASRDEGTEICN